MSVILSRVYILAFSLRGTQVVLCSYCSVHFLSSFEISRFPVKLIYYFARIFFFLLRVTDSGNCAESDRNSATVTSSAEINRLSCELNWRLSRELDEMMSSVNTEIQRAISDAISNQILTQIQTALSAGSGHLTQSRWNVPSKRPEINPEEPYGEKTKKTLDVSNVMIIKMIVNLKHLLTTLELTFLHKSRCKKTSLVAFEF